MPARDIYHDTVKSALIKDGWTITHDPLRIRLARGRNLFMDLGNHLIDSLITQYCEVVEKTLKDYANFLGNDDEVQVELVFDRERDRYLLVEAGWQNGYRIYGTLLHIDIINNTLWIQHDGTEEGIADELVAAGIPKDHIVLGFKSLEGRKHTEFAIS